MKIEEFLEGERQKRAAKAIEAAQAEKQDLGELLSIMREIVQQNATLADQNAALAARVAAVEGRAPDVRTEVTQLAVEPTVIATAPKAWEVEVIRGEDGLIKRLRMTAQ